ncbi:alpha/beta hydrolase [Fodinicola feengrottensis]|uniref:Alpha/beta hydrolase n=1 Tax=Fodinicola feengrottensis TaxID=435914 RepID=A0ABN2IUA7_9ACTN
MPLPDQDTMDPRLAMLVAEVMSQLPADLPALPSPWPAPGQSRAEWLAEVTAVRAAHDAPADVLAQLLPAAPPDAPTVSDREVEVEGGRITVRVYTPAGEGPFPALVYYHGGAWWLGGGFALTDLYCQRFCAALGSVVVNVDYRLAPESPYPQQLEDAYAALLWTVSSLRPTEVSVAGASSGGNLAAALCLLARDRGGPAIRSQLLHVPGLDLTLSSPSLRADPAVLPNLDGVRRLYSTDWENPYVSPLLATDLAGLPPAVIVTGRHDFLRDDGRRYAERLSEAGVPVVALEYPMLHNIALPETIETMVTEMTAALLALSR